MKISVKAIFAGIGVFVLSLLFIFFILILFILFYSVEKIPALLDNNAEVLDFLSEFLGIIIALLSGFFTAKVADRNELLHGFIIGGILFIALVFIPDLSNDGSSDSEVFDIKNVLLSFLSVIESMAGAYIQLRIKNKREQTSPIEDKIERLGQNDEK